MLKCKLKCSSLSNCKYCLNIYLHYKPPPIKNKPRLHHYTPQELVLKYEERRIK